MKIDRAEVERLAKIAIRAERDQLAVRVDPGKLAKLCRLALEVMDAPVGEIRGNKSNASNYSLLVTMHGPLDAAPELLERVRLVRVGEE